MNAFPVQGFSPDLRRDDAASMMREFPVDFWGFNPDRRQDVAAFGAAMTRSNGQFHCNEASVLLFSWSRCLLVLLEGSAFPPSVKGIPFVAIQDAG